MAHEFWFTGERFKEMHTKHLVNALIWLEHRPDHATKLLKDELKRRGYNKNGEKEKNFEDKSAEDLSLELRLSVLMAQMEHMLMNRVDRRINEVIIPRMDNISKEINAAIATCNRLEIALAANEARMNGLERRRSTNSSNPRRPRSKIRK